MKRSTLVAAIALVAIFSLSASAQTFLAEDWSTASGATPPAGWSKFDTGTNPTTWRFDNPQGNSYTGGLFSGNFAIVDSDWAGSSTSGTSVLRGPVFSVAGATTVNLSFDVLYDDISVGGTPDEMALVDVWDGTAWNNVVMWNADQGVGVGAGSGAEVPFVLDITAAAGGSNARLRFTYLDYTWDWAWAFDNLVVDQPSALDLAVLSIDAPVDDPSSCTGFSNAETVTITCEWQGTTPLAAGDTIQFDLAVDGGVPQIEFYITTATYNFGDQFTVTLMNTADLSAPGAHTIDVTGTYFGDTDPVDDTASTSLGGAGFAPVTIGWFEDFESFGTSGVSDNTSGVAPAGWVNDPNDGASIAGNTYPDWRAQLNTTGSTNGGPLNGDHTTGTTTGWYMNIEDSSSQAGSIQLITPCLDGTGALAPTLSFWQHSDCPIGSTNDNILSVDIIDAATGAMIMMDAGTFASNGVGSDWTLQTVDLTPFQPTLVRAVFRTDNLGTYFDDDESIDDVALIDFVPDIGQAPQPGSATFDINGSLNLNAQPVSSGANGPYFTSVAEGGSFSLTTTGQPIQAITVIYGPLNRQVATFPFSGQLDIGTPDITGDGIPESLSVFVDAIAWASGGFIGFPIDAMFFTNAAGSNTVNFTFPIFGLPSGTPITTFQNVITQSGGAPFIGNAVDVVIQ